MTEHNLVRVLSVIGWHDRFENNRSREVKDAKWFACPNSFDGDRISELLSHENGAAHYGAWCAILGVASTCDVRGTLLRDNGKPYCADSLSWKTRIPAKVFNEAIPRMIDIGLIEVLAMEVDADKDVSEIPQEGAIKPQEGATIPQEPAGSSIPFSSLPFPSVSDSEKQKNEKSKSHPAYAKCSESQARAIYDQYPRRVGKAEAVKAIVKAVAAIAGDEAHPGHDDPLTWLQRRVVTYAGSPRGQPPPKGEADYRPHPATWFNQARYDDDDGEWQQPNGNGPTGPAATKPGRDDWRERKAAREYTHDEPPPRNL